jgi:hypothetical protein
MDSFAKDFFLVTAAPVMIRPHDSYTMAFPKSSHLMRQFLKMLILKKGLTGVLATS